MKQKKDTFFNQANILREHNQYKKALKYFLKGAEQQDVSCYLNLGYMYDIGEGTEIDKEQAMYWYKKGAAEKNSACMSNIAILYKEQGRTKKAIRWFKKSLMQDDSTAAYEIALLYLQQAKIEKVEKYLQLAVQHPDALYKNKLTAYKYLKRLETFKSHPSL